MLRDISFTVSLIPVVSPSYDIPLVLLPVLPSLATLYAGYQRLQSGRPRQNPRAPNQAHPFSYCKVGTSLPSWSGRRLERMRGPVRDLCHLRAFAPNT